MPAQLIGDRKYQGAGLFQAVIGDLLDEPTDAIVNAANGFLAHGGGVAAAIARAAGPALEAEGEGIVKQRGPIATGGAVATTAGRLRFKGVIHAVGPRLGDGDEEDRIVRALRSAFAIASEKGWASLSFPAISSGIFSVPAPTCVRAYLRGVDDFFAENPASSLRMIRLAVFPGVVADELAKAMR
jgi:putative ATPase